MAEYGLVEVKSRACRSRWFGAPKLTSNKSGFGVGSGDGALENTGKLKAANLFKNVVAA